MSRWQVWVMLGLVAPAEALLAEEVGDTRARQRLEKPEGRSLETYSQQPGVPYTMQRNSSSNVSLPSPWI